MKIGILRYRLPSPFSLLLIALAFHACQSDIETEISSEAPVFSFEEGESLKDAATFPVGNIWAAGHPTWGNTKGTDLGGPNDNFTASAFGPLSTVVMKQLELPLEDELIAQQFNSITPEVALKPHNISISPDSIDFREADAMMEYAEANGLRVHGHVLLFEKSVPEWALEYEANDVWTEEQWETWLEEYITTVVGRYRGRIAAWDVLNEIGSVFGGGLNTDYFWWRVIGPDFIEKAFRWAEAADPEAKLFINDFALGFFPLKLQDIIQLADDLRSAGCKVDGIGFQGHIVLPFLMGDYELNKRAYAKAANAGYLVHISELDIAVNALGLTQEQSDFQHRMQRKRYNDIARAYLDGVPADKQWGITIWNISDRNSFYNTVQIWFDLRLFGGEKDFPMLWDEDYQLKPAYYGFRNGLRGEYEGWLFPEIESTGRRASLPEREANELSWHLNHSKEALMEVFGLPPSDADEMIRQARDRAAREGLVE